MVPYFMGASTNNLYRRDDYLSNGCRTVISRQIKEPVNNVESKNCSHNNRACRTWRSYILFESAEQEAIAETAASQVRLSDSIRDIKSDCFLTTVLGSTTN